MALFGRKTYEKASPKRDTKSTASGKLTINMKSSQKIGSVQSTSSGTDFDNSVPLDILEAKKAGKWVCRYCETINERADSFCASCGKRN